MTQMSRRRLKKMQKSRKTVAGLQKDLETQVSKTGAFEKKTENQAKEIILLTADLADLQRRFADVSEEKTRALELLRTFLPWVQKPNATGSQDDPAPGGTGAE